MDKYTKFDSWKYKSLELYTYNVPHTETNILVEANHVPFRRIRDVKRCLNHVVAETD